MSVPPENIEWKDGYCPTCNNNNKLNNTYCNYNCLYQITNDNNEIKWCKENNYYYYSGPTYSQKGYEIGWCSTCTNKQEFDLWGYCGKLCEYKLYDNMFFKKYLKNYNKSYLNHKNKSNY